MGRLMSTHAGSKRSDLRTSDDKSPRSAPFRHVALRSTTPEVSSDEGGVGVGRGDAMRGEEWRGE